MKSKEFKCVVRGHVVGSQILDALDSTGRRRVIPDEARCRVKSSHCRHGCHPPFFAVAVRVRKSHIYAKHDGLRRKKILTFRAWTCLDHVFRHVFPPKDRREEELLDGGCFIGGFKVGWLKLLFLVILKCGLIPQVGQCGQSDRRRVLEVAFVQSMGSAASSETTGQHGVSPEV